MLYGRQSAVLAVSLLAAALISLWLVPQARGAPGNGTDLAGSPLPAEELRELEEARARLDRRGEGERPETRVDEDPEGNPYVAGELIVTYEEQASAHAEDAAREEAGAEVEEELPTLDAELVSIPEVKEERDEAEREEVLEDKKQELVDDNGVESVDYNYLREKAATPTDPYYRYQWGMQRIEAPIAHNKTTGSGAVIAVVDGGAQSSHSDLAGAFVDEYDYYNDDGTANDEDGHGTHVSGIAGARANNGRGIAGTAPNAALLNYDVCGQSYCKDDAIARAIDDAAKLNADVINMSLGGGGRSSVLEGAVNRAWNSGVVLVAAAGNDATSRPSYPAAYSNVVAVGATTQSNSRAYFSNTGSHLDIVAPGVDVLSSVPGGYDYYDGTSMATPFVSGVAALLASQGSSDAQIRYRLESTGTDLGPLGKDGSFGSGLVDAQAAVDSPVASTPPPSATPPPEDGGKCKGKRKGKRCNRR